MKTLLARAGPAHRAGELSPATWPWIGPDHLLGAGRPSARVAGHGRARPASVISAKHEGQRAAGPASGSTLDVLGAVDPEEHDHEEEQDDDGAGVDDDLHGGQEVGLLLDEEDGHPEERHHQA